MLICERLNMPILKLREDDPEREIEFELEYQACLTVQQRLDMMLQKSREMAMLQRQCGHRKTPENIKRDALHKS